MVDKERKDELLSRATWLAAGCRTRARQIGPLEPATRPAVATTPPSDPFAQAPIRVEEIARDEESDEAAAAAATRKERMFDKD